jgi:hypothetical protein
VRWGVAGITEKADVKEMMAVLIGGLQRGVPPPTTPPPRPPGPTSPPQPPEEDTDQKGGREGRKEKKETATPAPKADTASSTPGLDTSPRSTGARTRSRHEMQRKQHGLKAGRVGGPEAGKRVGGRRLNDQPHLPSSEEDHREGNIGSKKEETGEERGGVEGIAASPGLPKRKPEWGQPEREGRPLNIKLPNGKTMEVDYRPEANADYLMQKLQDKEGLPKDRMILRSGMRLLRPGISLREQGVKAEDNITMVPNHICGGGLSHMIARAR